MNNYKLYINSQDITKYSSEIEWGDNMDSVGSEFSFKSLKKLYIGDKFLLTNNNIEVIRGILTDESYDKHLIYTYSGFCFGFYLNKNEVIIQFNNVSASDAIRQLLNKVSIPVGNIPAMSTPIKKIYKDVVVYDIMKEILTTNFKKSGYKHIIEVNQGKVDILSYSNLGVNGTYELLPNQSIDITSALSSFSCTNSIQEMKNSVIVVDNKENSTRIKSQAKDSNNISKFGLLQQIETVNDDNTKQAVVASTLLKDLNKIANKISVEMLGSDNVRSARILKFNYPELGFIGYYQVKSCKHRVINNNNHKINMELEKYVS